MIRRIVSFLAVTVFVFNVFAFAPMQTGDSYVVSVNASQTVTAKAPKVKLIDKTSFSVHLKVTNADSYADYQVKAKLPGGKYAVKASYNDNGELIVTGLSANKKYTLKIRSYTIDGSGKKQYSPYSKALSVKTKKAQSLNTTKTKASVDSSQVKMTKVKEYSKTQDKNCARLVNFLRKDKGLGTLKWDETLYKVALERAKETTKYYRHTRPDGTSCFTISSTYDGENIVPRGNAYMAYVAWFNSPAHYENMVWPDFTRIAVAGVWCNGNYYFVMAFGY